MEDFRALNDGYQMIMKLMNGIFPKEKLYVKNGMLI